MKRIVLIALTLVLMLLCCSCAKKTSPTIKFNSDNVNSVVFKSNTDSGCKQKLITEKTDIKNICSWLKSIKLTKHSAIEIPTSEVSYIIEINGKADHKIIVMDEFLIYDSVAYTFNKKTDLNSIEQKYKLFAYKETDSELGLL